MNKKHRQSAMRRLAALGAAILLTLSLAISTAAAGTPVTPDSKGSFTVSGLENGVTVSAYQVMSVNMGASGPKNPMYQWENNVASWLDTKSDYKKYKTADGAVSESFTEAKAGDLKSFWHDLAAAIKDGSVSLTASDQEAAGDSVTFTQMAMGEYLLTAKGGTKVYQPTTALLVPVYKEGSWVLENGSVGLDGSSMKGETPDIEKDVDDATVSVGQTLTYTLTATVPLYPEDATALTFRVGDKLSDGLTYQTGTLKVYQDEDHTQEIAESGNYEVSTTPGEREDYTFQVSFSESFVKNPAYAGESIYVVYQAKVNEKAVTIDEIKNTAYIEYNNDPYDQDSYQKVPTEKEVYTYAIELKKIDKEDTALSGAEFALAKADSSGTPLKFKKTEDGSYVYDPEGTGNTTVLAVSDTGTLKLDGLDTGTYLLTETKAPAGGYVLPTGKITIVLTDAEPDGTLDQSTTTATPDGSYQIKENSVQISGDTLKLSIVNGKGFDLPVTGDRGTVMFTVTGIALMGSAAALWFLLSKRRKRNG